MDSKYLYKTVLAFLSIVFFLNNKGFSQDTLIKSGSEWQYYDEEKLHIEDFGLNRENNNIEWKVGKTPMGFGQNDEATELNQTIGEDTIVTIFLFQKELVIEDVDAYKSYLLRLVRDDGAIVYVNNKEILRSNMPDGEISSKSLATGFVNGIAEYKFHEYFITPSHFRNGKNIIRVALFQYSSNSSDCRFDMELISYNDFKVLNQLIHNLNSERKLLENELELYAVERMLQEKNNEIKYLSLKQNINRNFFVLILSILMIAIVVLGIYLLRIWKGRQGDILKFKMLEKDCDSKSKELINLSLSLLKVKQFIGGLSDDLKRINEEANESNRMEIERLQNRIEFHKQFEEDWERLKMHFDTIHSGFFARLKSRFPELTQSELRHCVYIKLQMFTSEIAQMFNVDSKSVQTSRYRIKKKLQLPQEVDLKTFLEDF